MTKTRSEWTVVYFQSILRSTKSWLMLSKESVSSLCYHTCNTYYIRRTVFKIHNQTGIEVWWQTHQWKARSTDSFGVLWLRGQDVNHMTVISPVWFQSGTFVSRPAALFPHFLPVFERIKTKSRKKRQLLVSMSPKMFLKTIPLLFDLTCGPLVN